MSVVYHVRTGLLNSAKSWRTKWLTQDKVFGTSTREVLWLVFPIKSQIQVTEFVWRKRELPPSLKRTTHNQTSRGGLLVWCNVKRRKKYQLLGWVYLLSTLHKTPYETWIIIHINLVHRHRLFGKRFREEFLTEHVPQLRWTYEQ